MAQSAAHAQLKWTIHLHANASTLPRVTTGNTMAASVIVGERVAALLHGSAGIQTRLKFDRRGVA